MANDFERPEGDYEVGYGKPPVEHRFQPGHQRNQKRHAKSDVSMSMMMGGVLAERRRVEINGKVQSLPTSEILMRKLVNMAATSDAARDLLYQMRLASEQANQSDEPELEVVICP